MNATASVTIAAIAGRWHPDSPAALVRYDHHQYGTEWVPTGDAAGYLTTDTGIDRADALDLIAAAMRGESITVIGNGTSWTTLTTPAHTTTSETTP